MFNTMDVGIEEVESSPLSVMVQREISEARE
jgi:hypothetical protein